jgi:hypothetical protein
LKIAIRFYTFSSKTMAIRVLFVLAHLLICTV